MDLLKECDTARGKDWLSQFSLMDRPVAALRALDVQLISQRQKVIHVAGTFVFAMRVLEIEVEIALLDLIDGDAPSPFVFNSGFEAVLFRSPPFPFCFKYFDADGLPLL